MILHYPFKPLFLAATIALLMTSCSSKKDQLRKKQAGLYFGAGTQSLMEKDYTEALKNLLEADKLEPNNTDILNNLGMAYYFKGEEDTAIRYLNEALELNPANSDAKVNLASIYFKNKKYSESEKFYKKVLKDLTYDKQARTYLNLGIIELQTKSNSKTAEEYFKKSIAEDNNYCPAYYQLGLIQYKNRQLNSALRNFKEATMGPCYDSPAPHYYQALVHIEKRNFLEARLKLDDITTRFKKNSFAQKARRKVIELNEIEQKKSNTSHASKMVLESPDF